jgi:type III restriction enzyme
MPAAVIEYPILNSPFAEPSSQWGLDDNGISAGIVFKGRRRSEFIVLAPPAKHKMAAPAFLDHEAKHGNRRVNNYINKSRGEVTQWRQPANRGCALLLRCRPR